MDISKKLSKFSLNCLLSFSYLRKPLESGHVEIRRRRLKEISSEESILCLPACSPASHSDGPKQVDFLRSNRFSFKLLGLHNGMVSAIVQGAEEQAGDSSSGQQTSTLRHHHQLWHFEHRQPERVPKFFRYYWYVSQITLLYISTKYIFLGLCALDSFEYFPKKHECLWPGRTCILPEISPSFTMVILSYHIVYRLYMHFYRKFFLIECFNFILQDEQTVAEKEARLGRSPTRVSREEAQQMYFADGMYYHFITQMDGRKVLHLRCNRTTEHWRNMRKFYDLVTTVMILNFLIWSVPLASLIIYTALSDEFFELAYGHCKEYALRLDQLLGREPMAEDVNKLTGTYRWISFSLDMFDNSWILFDTANALVWPFASMIILAQDVTYSVQTLNIATLALIERLRQLAISIGCCTLDELGEPQL